MSLYHHYFTLTAAGTPSGCSGSRTSCILLLSCLDDPESLMAVASVGYGFAEFEALYESPRILFRLSSLQVTFNS